MDAHRAYSTDTLPAEPPRASARERYQAVRSELVRRGSSLRAWSIDWARRYGADEIQAPWTVRMVVQRWAHRTDAPRGSMARAIMRDLRADLGPEVVPPLDNTE